MKPAPREMHSGAYFKSEEGNAKFYIFGGRVNRREIDDSIHSLDLETNTWNKLEIAMPRVSCAHCCTAINNTTIALFGGTNGGIPFYEEMLLFDFSANKWRTVDYEKLKDVRNLGREEEVKSR